MRISIERDILLKSLGHIQSVVERRNTIPILSNVKIIADDNGITLTATDLDLEIIEKLEKANESLRLKRKKPVLTSNTLEKCMNLKVF